MEYLVGGYTMRNDILFSDGSAVTDQLGGSVFSAAGIRLWRDSVAYIGVAGKDFEESYGPYFERNGIAAAVCTPLPHTLHYVMEYDADGSWKEFCKHGEEYEAMAYEASLLTPAMFAPLCSADTKGIYLEASLNTTIVNHFEELRAMMPGGKLMWEIATGDLLNPQRHQRLRELIGQVDAYSINFNEAKAFFSVETEEEALAALLVLKKPCFFRAGTKGAYLIQNGTITFLHSIGTESSVDATGCGNCSTATALIGLAEGLPAAELLAMANISAAYNAKQYGPWPLADEATRAEARQLLAKLAPDAVEVTIPGSCAGVGLPFPGAAVPGATLLGAAGGLGRSK